MIAGTAFAFACSSSPPAAPRNEATNEGSGADSIKQYFDAYAKGDWSAMRAAYHDTANVFHNASVKMTADSIIAFHKARREAYEKVETTVYVPLVLKMGAGSMAGEHWRIGWADINLTVKGTGEVVRLPINIAWMIKDGKIVREHAFYNSLGVYQALMKAQEQASTKK